MSVPARGVHDRQSAGGLAAEPRAGRALPAPLLPLMGQLELEFVFFLESLAPGVELPGADVGFDRIVARQPRRLSLHQHINLAQRVDRYLARIPLPDLSNRIAAGELGPAIWLGCASVTAGLINAASMST